jgi:hypothetical protein
MTPPAQEEYTALRATIRERGTARVWIFVAGIVCWTAATIATAALAATPVATLLPLLLLASVFEAIFAVHIAVERIGRFIQVFYEIEPGSQAGPGPLPGWEHTAMAFGRPRGSPSIDPLFSLVFCLAAVFNVAPATLLNPRANELIFVGGAHALFLLRVVVARQSAARQRAIDLERFNQLKSERTRP